jgi:hypothetical protein
VKKAESKVSRKGAKAQRRDRRREQVRVLNDEKEVRAVIDEAVADNAAFDFFAPLRLCVS